MTKRIKQSRSGKVNFKTTNGILDEIEASVNEFKEDLSKHDEVEIRLRGCNAAIKVHMLEFMQDKMGVGSGQAKIEG